MGKYIILAGDTERPATVIGQHLEKGSGQTAMAQGGQVHQYILQKQDIGIPNYTQAWGMRIIEEGKTPTNPIDVKDPKYKGQIKFLKWGDKDGYLIACRYLEGYQTLDVQYQDLVLNASQTIKVDDASSADVFFIRLTSGENIFDEDAHRYMCQMLKIHSYNQNSDFKNPSNYNWLFAEKNTEELKSDTIFNKQFEALKIVNEAAQDNGLTRLKNLRQVLNQILPLEIKDEELYRTLSETANQSPELVLGQVGNYKKGLSNTYEKLKSYKAIDLTKDGFVGAGKEDKNVFEAEGKGEAMLTWLLANFLEEKVWATNFELTQIADKLK